MPKITFAMIDAKDSEVIGIDGARPSNNHNAIIMGQAEAEYLNGLLELQKRIKEEYEHRLIENKYVKWNNDEDVKAQREANDVAYEEKYKRLEKGADNLYYT